MTFVINWTTGLRPVLTAAIAASMFVGPALAQKAGGSITVALELEVPGFDPIKVGVFDTAAQMASSLIFDTLTTIDDSGKAASNLAESWTHSDDFKTWTFKLRSGVKFHDGTPFNAHAVAWNFARQKDPANKCRCAFFVQGIDKVEATDDLTVVFHLRDPSTNFAELRAPTGVNNVMQSPAAIQKLGDDYNRNPVGTGPFIVKSWAAGDRMVLERNPNYWKKDRPYLDRVVMRPLPDSQARFASLLAGETDLVWADSYEADSIRKARSTPDLTVHTHDGSGAAVFAFNTKVAPFDDVRVRRALVMALDRKKISEVATTGLAKPASNPYGDASWIKCKDDGALPYDSNKARELIREYGKPVEFKMLVTATPRGRTFGQIFQQVWKDVGAKVELEQVDQTTIPTRAFARQFQLTPWRIPDFVDPDISLFADFHTGSPVNLANYSNPELDRLLEHARASIDQDARIQDYCAISRLINQEATWFWLFQNTYFAIAKGKLKGLPKLRFGIIDVSNTWLE
jgi:4-phytase/acid phosphatase/peptide/nickel transport system substrate-binding protein